MPGGDTFFPPVQYQPWWGLIGFLLLAIVVGWYVWVFVSTRASRAAVPRVGQQAWMPGVPEAVRLRYLSLIDETRAAHAKGAIDTRQAHHQLSALVRSYVAERAGVRTEHLTLADLRTTPLTPLTEAVEKLYPGAFRAEYSGTVDQAATAAQRLVTTWN